MYCSVVGKYFKRILRTICICLLVVLYMVARAQRTAAVLKESGWQVHARNFLNPAVTYRPGAFWCWLNGDVTKASIAHDLAEMKDKGMGGAEIWDVAAIYNPGGSYGVGPAFLGDQSVGLIRYALKEGKRLGLKMGIVGASGWNAGGAWVRPEWASKALYVSEMKLSGPFHFADTLPLPVLPEKCPKDEKGIPVYLKNIAVLAVRNHPGKKINSQQDIIILNKFFDGKRLLWDVPPGEWKILRFICTNTGQHLIVPSPNSDGLFIDFLDPVATKKYLTYFLQRLGIHKANAGASGLNSLSFDSMELDEATPWTGSMDSIFSAHHGYNILSYLPAFAGWQLPGGNERFLQQFKKTVSDQLIFSHYTTARDFLKDYGIELVAEAGGPGPPLWNTCPVEAIKALGNVSVPRGEFWVRNRYNLFLVKEIASASHIYGLNSVDAESFTTWRRWKDAPHDLKTYADRAFCEGLNKITLCAFSNTRPEFGLPGRSLHAGADINPTNTWWKEARPFMDYLSRCSYLLQQGKSVADVAYYYGDKAPNFFPALQGSPERPSLPGLSPGYDFDIINTDVLLNRITVLNGRFQLPDGLQYRLLVMPAEKDVPVEVLRKVKKMMAAGAAVIFSSQSDKKETDTRSRQVNTNIDAALQAMNISKDFTADHLKFDFIHRKISGGDVYFVRNKTNTKVEEDCVFRSQSSQVEYWDPVHGSQYRITDGTKSAGNTSIKIRLAPYASCFIIFSANSRSLPQYQLLTPSSQTEIKDGWTIYFPENWGAPPSVKPYKLISWTEMPDEGVQYFSGTASYKNSMDISAASLLEDSAVNMQFGEILDVAKVIINGTVAGVIWTPPNALDIKKYLKEGKNEIEIQVTNLWINRLTGDMNAGDGKKYCQTNIPYIKNNRTANSDEAFHIQPAGLIGGVHLNHIKYTSLHR
jgi:hypothetical protein